MTIALEIRRRPKISTKDELQWDAVVARDRKYDDFERIGDGLLDRQ